MGKLPEGPFEVRLAATLFLLLLGLADLFGAWQVKNFAAFTPSGIARTVGALDHSMPEMGHGAMEEKPVDLSTLNEPTHHIPRELLVQDTHVHVPVYAMTAAFLAILLFGLRLSSRARTGLVFLAFAAPFLDFAGLWGAHLSKGGGRFWGAIALLGGLLIGLAYLAVLVLVLNQCWFQRKGGNNV
jgi:hypothetical protein